MKKKKINGASLIQTMKMNSDADGGVYTPGRGMPPTEYNSLPRQDDISDEDRKNILEKRKEDFLKKRKEDREKSNKDRKERIAKRDSKKRPIKSKSKEVTAKKVNASILQLINSVSNFTCEIDNYAQEYPDRRDILFRLDKMNRMSQMYIKAMQDLQRRMK